MNVWQKPIRTITSTTIINLIASSAIYAAGFSLYTESSGEATGNFAAGIAAEAADATIGWYNPAGLVLIPRPQLVLGGVGIFPVAKITGISTFSTLNFDSYQQTFANLNGAENAFVPSVHFAYPWNKDLTLALSIVSPFGLSTKWSENGPVRYEATTSDLMTVNISPEAGLRVNDYFAIGAGLDLQYARVKFNRMLGSPALLAEFTSIIPSLYPAILDSLSYNKGNAFDVGFHVGVMAMFNDNHTRIGLNYQSRVGHSFKGYSKLTGRLVDPNFNINNPASIPALNPDAAAIDNNLTSNRIQFPDVLTLSVYQDVNNKLAILGSIVYTGWSSFKKIELNNVMAYIAPSLKSVTSTSLENFRNVWRFAVGANYDINQRLMLRLGTGYDQTPTIYAERSVRLPDSSRWALAIGGRYQINTKFLVDLGYTRLFMPGHSPLNRTDVAGVNNNGVVTSNYNVNARATGYANLVGAQLTWLIDQEAPVTI